MDHKPTSIPFRFKDGIKAPVREGHHRTTAKVSHKPFKSKHATKGSIKETKKGKVEDLHKGSRKTPHQQVMSKFDRKNQAAQKRQIRKQQNLRSRSVFSGQNGAPRVVAVVPLCSDLDPTKAINKLVQSVDADFSAIPGGLKHTRIDRFKQNVTFVPVQRVLRLALDACRSADFILLLLSPAEDVDQDGESILRAIESQGVSNVLTLVQNLNSISGDKKQAQAVTSLKSYIAHFFPSQDKVHSVDSERECANVIRTLCKTTPKGIIWREERSWMLVEDVVWPQIDSGTQAVVKLAGVVRGKGMKAERLVQVGDWGKFQIEKITDASLPAIKTHKTGEMTLDEERNDGNILEQPDEDQDDLAELAPEVIMEDVDDFAVSEAPSERRGVLLDDYHYFPDDEPRMPQTPKRLPSGTSPYQAAWFLGDMSDSGSEYEDVQEHTEDAVVDALALPQDGIEDLGKDMLSDPSEDTSSEQVHSEMFLDPSSDEETSALAEYRFQRRSEAKEDREFPDEIELCPDELARERLARYRGLKSLKTSHWDTRQDQIYEPADWGRLLRVTDYKRARKQVINETLIGGIAPGRRVNIYIRAVPLYLQKKYDPAQPLCLYSLLRHEQKRTVVHFSITLSSANPEPLKSKDPLVMQCGPRRFLINPLYSQSGSTPNNVHKFLRFIHPGQTAVASVIAPIIWGSVPALFFRPSFNKKNQIVHESLIATGTSMPPDRSRIMQSGSSLQVILTRFTKS